MYSSEDVGEEAQLVEYPCYAGGGGGVCCHTTGSSSDVLKSGNLYTSLERRVMAPVCLLESGELGSLSKS